MHAAFLDARGAVVRTFREDVRPSPFRDGRAQCEILLKKSQSLRSGFLGTDGREVIKARFLRARDFSEGLAAVDALTDDRARWGYIDRAGEWVVPPRLESADAFSDGLAQGSDGFIDREGRLVLKRMPGLRFDRFREGRVGVQEETSGLSGFMDKSGRWAVPARYGRIGPYSGGMASVRREGGWSYIGLDGGVAIEGRFRSAEPFHDGLARVTATLPGQTPTGQIPFRVREGYIDPAGSWVASWTSWEHGPLPA
jgi:hypothetical protein